MAAGYVNNANAIWEKLPDDEKPSPQGRALRMFITRDYRSLTPDSVVDASSLEQAAWMWAIQECGRNDLMSAAPGVLAAKAASPAFLPLDFFPGVGEGHRYTQAAVRLSTSLDILDILAWDELPESRRGQYADECCDILDIDAADDLEAQVDAIGRSIAAKGIEEVAFAYAGINWIYKSKDGIGSHGVLTANPAPDKLDEWAKGMVVNAFKKHTDTLIAELKVQTKAMYQELMGEKKPPAPK